MGASGTYIGRDPFLRGEHALLRDDPEKPGRVLAQFDKHGLKQSHGWHEFAADDFERDPPVDFPDEEIIPALGEEVGPRSGGAYYSKLSFKERFWRACGFSYGHAERIDVDGDEWAPGYFIVETFVHLDWGDRVRALISGRLRVEQAVKADVLITRLYATSGVGVLPPGTPNRRS